MFIACTVNLAANIQTVTFFSPQEDALTRFGILKTAHCRQKLAPELEAAPLAVPHSFFYFTPMKADSGRINEPSEERGESAHKNNKSLSYTKGAHQ
jgi:hypothetical protein